MLSILKSRWPRAIPHEALMTSPSHPGKTLWIAHPQIPTLSLTIYVVGRPKKVSRLGLAQEWRLPIGFSVSPTTVASLEQLEQRKGDTTNQGAKTLASKSKSPTTYHDT